MVLIIYRRHLITCKTICNFIISSVEKKCKQITKKNFYINL